MKCENLWRIGFLTLCLISSSFAASQLHQGKVKWFNQRSGFGFIQPDVKEEADEIFFHISVIEGTSKVVSKGQKVSYELIKKNNKWLATRVLPHPL